MKHLLIYFLIEFHVTEKGLLPAQELCPRRILKTHWKKLLQIFKRNTREIIKK